MDQPLVHLSLLVLALQEKEKTEELYIWKTTIQPSVKTQDKSFQERGEKDGKKTREEILQARGFGSKD